MRSSMPMHKPLSNYLKRPEVRPLLALLLAAALGIVFAKILSELLEGDLASVDRAILQLFRAPGNPSEPLGPFWLQTVARDITSLGGLAILSLVTIASLGYLALTRQWSTAVMVIVSVLGGTAISSAVKLLMQRQRPDFSAEVVHLHDYSFPSGHSLLSAVTYLTIGILLARAQSRLTMKIYLVSLAMGVTILVGLSRLYLGVHWPTDVLAGWCAGAAWAILCWSAAEWLHIRRATDEQVPC
jgi:undecaprenyl-diphosphatase